MRRLLPIAALAIVASTVALAFSHDTDVGRKLFGTGCQRQDRSVIINLDNTKHRHILDHVWDSIRGDEDQSVPRSRDGQPERALLHIDREAADTHRAQSLKGIPTKAGYDRDEYPPAASREGGKGADVRYVDSSENRSSGSVMSHQLSGFCDGQPFRFEHRPSNRGR